MSVLHSALGRRLAAIIAGFAILLASAAAATAPASAATSSIWGATSPAQVSLSADTASVELGTRFTAIVDGQATGVRFYKAPGAKGKHVGTLWSSVGKKLASVTFTRESASGWQSASFSTAVKLAAGQTYVVSYHVPKGGRYGMSVGAQAAATSPVLSVDPAKASVFRYGSIVVFPKSTATSRWYWADVTFVPGSGTSIPGPVVSPTPVVLTASVTSTPSVTPSAVPAPASDGSFDLGYGSRAELLADGWDFTARTAAGQSRDTEVSGAVAVTYSASGLKIPAGPGDLWRSLNDSNNNVFRDLPSDWSTVQLALDFAPVANDQQAGIAVYGDDDNYVQVVRHYSNGQSTALVAEKDGAVVLDRSVPTTATSLRLRLTRNGGLISGAVSADAGTTWTEVGDVGGTIDNPRVAITVGAYEGASGPTATVRQLTVSTSPDSAAPVARTSAPTGASPAPTQSATAPTQSATAPTPVPSATATSGSSSSAKGFPTRDTTGVPAGWSPKRTVSGDYTVTAAGSVLEDVRITGGDLYIRAPNVTVRNVEMVDGRIINFFASQCANGLLLENVSIVRRSSATAWDPAIEAGGYTARKLKIDGWWEGLRVGGTDFNPACGPVLVEDSWVNIQAPSECFTNPGSVDWHGDGLQGYGGAAVTLRNSYMQLIGAPPSCGGNATFFYPDQDNTRATIENVLLAGGGFTFRLGTPGSVSGLKIVDGAWEYGPSDVRDCSKVTWGSGNEVVRVNTDGSLTSVRPLACG